MPRIIGLTGLIGTGKSTVAGLCARLGVPVHDADACVHALYRNPAFVKNILKVFPFARTIFGKLDRGKLLDGLRQRPDLRRRLEAIIHPLVQADQQRFVQRHKRARIIILDVPLLFEAGMDGLCDEVWVTTSRKSLQRARVLRRPGFTPEKLDTVLRWQGPGEIKERAADIVINTAMRKGNLVWRLKKRIR